MTRNHRERLLAFVSSVLVMGACGGTPPPQPGVNTGAAPNLSGRRVLLLPVQQVVGVGGDPSAELAFALTGRNSEIDWVLEEEVERALERSPGINARTRGLPVGVFLQAEVQRVGDPLYGQLRRMAGLVGAEGIVLPVRVSWEANQDVVDATPRVRYTVVLIEPRTGRVRWLGIEEGDDFPQNDPRALASAAERLAQRLLWYAPAEASVTR